MRKIIIALSLSAAMPLAGCAGLQTNLATQTSAQVTTLAAAIQATTLVNQGTDTWVKTANPSVAQLTKVQTLASAVHIELQAIEKAQAAGQSLVFTAFNQALTALQQYEAANASSSAATSAVS